MVHWQALFLCMIWNHPASRTICICFIKWWYTIACHTPLCAQFLLSNITHAPFLLGTHPIFFSHPPRCEGRSWDVGVLCAVCHPSSSFGLMWKKQYISILSCDITRHNQPFSSISYVPHMFFLFLFLSLIHKVVLIHSGGVGWCMRQMEVATTAP